MPDPCEVVDRLAHDSTSARRPSRSYESSPASSFARFSRSRSARARPAVRTSSTPLPLDDDRAVRVEHDDVALADVRARDLDGLADRRPEPASPLRSRARTAPRSATRPLGASSRSRTAASTSSAATPATFACVASSSPTSATGLGSGIVTTSTSPGSASATRRVDHQVVVLAAAHGSRRAGRTRARHDLDQRHVDHLSAPGGLVHRRGAQPSELGVAGPSQRAHHLRRHALERLGVPDRSVPRGASCVVARAARRAASSRCGGTTAPSSPPSRRSSARSPA